MSDLKIQENIELKNFCTFAIGGPAKFFTVWKQHDEIVDILKWAKENHEQIFVFGGGSNLLFSDAGFNGLVIRNMTSQIELENRLLKVDSGLSWVRLFNFLKDKDVYGLEAFSGLPGSIGGAAYGNAGCHGTEMKDVLEKVEYVDTDTLEFHELEAKDIGFNYRHSEFKEYPERIITRVWFRLSDNPDDNTGDPHEFAEFRKAKQPQGLTTGSFFKNPEGDYAGRLIESSGMKGRKVGGIQTSDKHANFFLNDGTGTEQDVLELKDTIIQAVKEKEGIELEPEVQIIGSRLN
jgi:UDP-N-acetylmuramate dehydrogenase